MPIKLISKWSAVAMLLTTGGLLAQNPGVQRTIIQRKDVSMPGREAVIARVELAPKASAGRHTHPGEEISYVLEGQVDILIDGQPVQHEKPGDSFVIPSGAIHDARNTGTTPVKLVAVYLVDKSKPLATPAADAQTH